MATGLLGALESAEEGNVLQAALRAGTSGIVGQLSPKIPKRLYHYFSSEDLNCIQTTGLRVGTAGKVWASDMPPEEFNSIRLGGPKGIKVLDDFPFLKIFTKRLNYVAEIDPAGFEPAALTYKQMLGQFESGQPIPPTRIKVRPLD